MDLGIEGKTAVVSGSTAGIGFAAAEALAREGARVVVNGRTQMRVNAAVAALKKKIPDVNVVGVAADLATQGGADALLSRVPQADILVNSLGIYEPKPFLTISDADWRRFFEVNVLSGVRLSRAYFPGMVERGWGRIVFVSSESALQPPVEMIHYGMTKTAQLAVARGLAEMTPGTGVTVNSVLPGPTASEGVAHFVAGMTKEMGMTAAQAEAVFFKTIRPGSLLQRFAATNGAALRVDGGVVRSII
jgi:NAD(P)-dependent dehydrogenase (short-subunit alcohol dehydrogenase family)